MSGWESLGQLLGGGIDRESAYAKGQLESAKILDAVARARGSRDTQLAREAGRDLDWTNPDVINANLGTLMTAGWGSDFSAIRQGLLDQQKHSFREQQADVATSPEKQVALSAAVTGNYDVFRPVGSHGFYDVRDLSKGVQQPVDASGQPLAGGNLPASLQELAALKAMTPEEQENFWRIKRAEKIIDIGGVPTRVSATGRIPLSTQQAEIEAITQRERAKERAKADVEQEQVGREKGAAFQAYQTAIESVQKSLAETETGFLQGRLPAITAKQQIAEGSVAVIAPILKQLFRSAGEGTFTDRDQAMLLAMVPQRTDEPETVREKIRMLNAVVSAKLGATNVPGQSSQTPSTPPASEMTPSGRKRADILKAYGL